MQYELTAIREHEIFVTVPPTKNGAKDFVINWSWEMNYDFSFDDQLQIKIAVMLNVIEPEGQPDIARFSTSHYFRVPQATMISNRLMADTSRNSEAHRFMATLVGISVGTMRGIVFARTVGILGHKIFMPVVDPSALFSLVWENKVRAAKSTA